MKNLKRYDTNKLVLQNRNSLTDLEGTHGYWSQRWGEGYVGSLRRTGTLLYLKWITTKDLLYGTGKSAQCDVLVWMGREFGGEWIHAYL